MGTSMRVRPATAADEERVRALGTAALEAGELGDFEAGDVDGVATRLRVASHPVLVAEAEDAVIGWLDPAMEFLVVTPRHRRLGAGRALVTAAERVVEERGDPPLELAPPPGQAGAIAFLRAIGYARGSSLYELVLPAAVPLEPPRFDAPFLARSFRPGPDDERYVDLVNTSFADHPSPLHVSVPLVREAHGRPGFDPRGVHVVAPAADPERLVAFARAQPPETPGARGEVRLIGVLPEWRGHGLGRELLRWGVEHVRANGAGEVVLTVHARNERALGLYERAGFQRRREWPRWVRSGGA